MQDRSSFHRFCMIWGIPCNINPDMRANRNTVEPLAMTPLSSISLFTTTPFFVMGWFPHVVVTCVLATCPLLRLATNHYRDYSDFAEKFCWKLLSENQRKRFWTNVCSFEATLLSAIARNVTKYCRHIQERLFTAGSKKSFSLENLRKLRVT